MCSSKNISIFGNFVGSLWKKLIIAISISVFFQVTHSLQLNCSSAKQSFGIATGFVFNAPGYNTGVVSGTLNLTECLTVCRNSSNCHAVNFATGLCVLFNTSAPEFPTLLEPFQRSEIPIYAEKLCFEELTCSRHWVFERISNYKLLDHSKKIVPYITSIEKCMDMCLKEKSFDCRSANYQPRRNECQMSDFDRYSVQNSFQEYFVPAEDGTEYLENNCVDPTERLCKFKAIRGKTLKSVIAVFQDVKTEKGCRKKCLSVQFRCQAFDLGNNQNSGCRLSHLSRFSSINSENIYSDALESTTYEMESCYNVSVLCRSHEMVVNFQTSTIFNGIIYVKSRPNSCATDVLNRREFEIRMPYLDLDCDVKQKGNGNFSNELFIQHHDTIITSQDLGMKVHCQYDLANKSIDHRLGFGANNSKIDPYPDFGSKVAAPNISMKVTDSLGRDLSAAQVGDKLILIFQIEDENSPYDVFVRNLVAIDGKDNGEWKLIDDMGCPIDPLTTGLGIKKDKDNALKITFEAFKFPTSNSVMFKAFAKPCLFKCEQDKCDLHSSDGLGLQLTPVEERRRKRSKNSGRLEADEQQGEIVVERTVRVTSKSFD